ncbi:hypothetical protein D3C71_1716920 [compost metagenome]
MSLRDRIVYSFLDAFAVVRHHVHNTRILQLAVQHDQRNAHRLDMVNKSIILIALAHDENAVKTLRLNISEVVDAVDPVNGQVEILIQHMADPFDRIHKKA